MRIWVLVIFVFLLETVGCQGEMQKATIQLIDRTEKNWKVSSARNYRIVVEVQREGEIRRNEIMVNNGRIIDGRVTYRDTKKSMWTAPQKLTEAQALPYTVPGLFDTIREELLNGNRSNIRVSMKGNPPFPHLIWLDPVIQDNQPIPESKAVLTVQKYEVISS